MPSHLMTNVLGGPPLPVIDRADGVWLWDVEGKRYLDGSSGAVVTLIGHRHPRVIEAMTRQLDQVTFTHRGAFGSNALEELARRLCTLTGLAGAWFVNSGSEATEAAMQIALQYHAERGQPERQWFLSHRYGYHGNTLGGLSLSGHVRRETVRDLAHVFNTLPTPYAYRDAPDLPDAEYTARLLHDAREQFVGNPGTLAGVLIEPVGGATLGATVPPDGYLSGLRDLCHEFGGLFILDEVMTGLGRTGPALASDHWGVSPDIAAVGKGLGAGYFPIAASLVSEPVLDTLRSGSGLIRGGHTYAGNPLAAAAGCAVLDVIEEEDVFARGRAASVPLERGLRRLAGRHDLVGDLRGLGMLWSLELVDDPVTKTVAGPQGGLSRAVFQSAMDAGLVCYPSSGGINDAILIAPPLTITPDQIDQLVSSLDQALTRTAAVRGR